MASLDVDPSIKQAIRYLHSSARDSTEQMRLLLDKLIRDAHGPSKTMANVLPKKYLAEEKAAPPPAAAAAAAASSSAASSSSSKQVVVVKSGGGSGASSSSADKADKGGAKGVVMVVAPPEPSPQQIRIPERDDADADDCDDASMDNELTFKLLIEEDLICAVCRRISVQVGNQLVECAECHALYHQDCHEPPIENCDVSAAWQCAACAAAAVQAKPPPPPPVSMTMMAAASKQPSSLSSSSSSSTASSSSTKAPPPTSSSSAATGSSSKLVTPNINIIAADKRLQNMKKKAAKLQESKRKHSK